MAMVAMGGTCGYTHYYQATMLERVINCLRLFVIVIYCYHGDGSDGRHVCKSITAIRTTISNL